jgi:membrane dipeptidase
MTLRLDLHMDTPTKGLVHPEFRLDEKNGSGHVDLPRLREGGLDAAFFASWIEPAFDEMDGSAFRRAVDLLQLTRESVDGVEGARIVRTASELREAEEEGDLGIFLAVEGGHAIQASLERLGELARMGIRYMTLTWNHPNAWADACCSPSVHEGLTPFGKSVVREMDRLGVFPDLSHASDDTFWDTLDTSGRPPLVTHSCSRTLVDHPRNVTDEMAREIAGRGGILGINFFPAFVDGEYCAATRALEARLGPDGDRDERTATLRKIPPPSIDRLVDHFHHLADLAGPEYLALGSDFDGVPSLPEPLRDVSDLPLLRERLAGRGFSSEELDGIFGGNFLRMLEGEDQ